MARTLCSLAKVGIKKRDWPPWYFSQASFVSASSRLDNRTFTSVVLSSPLCRRARGEHRHLTFNHLRSQHASTMADVTERTFIMVKPDGVQRGLVGKIIKRFEAKGFKLVGLKFVWPTEDLLKQHYADLAARPFFPGLVKYMSSGPVVPMVWEGLNVVKTGRQILGATDPKDSAPGTIRGDLCIQVGRNILHGSDSVESAKKEINLWFQPKEVVDWKPAVTSWVYE